MQQDLDELVQQSECISSLPEIYTKIYEVVHDPDSTFENISEAITQDVGLSIRLLKMANSAFYSFPSEVETITHALSVIGTQQLLDLVLATSALNLFQEIPADLVSMENFWKHSVACGIAARTLALHRGDSNTERLYVIGLLHEIGRLFLFENMAEKSREILTQQAKDHSYSYKLERSVLGFDHAKVGGALLKAWKLPAVMHEVVSFHHSPSQAENYPVDTAIVHVADFLAGVLRPETCCEPFFPKMNTKAWERLGIPSGELPAIWMKMEIAYEGTIDVFLGN